MTRDVLLLPGMMLDARLWNGTVGGLGDAFACSVADLASADSIPDLADAALARAPHRFHFVGFSLGAIVAMAMWRRAPSRIASISLLGFSPHADDPLRRTAREDQMACALQGELAVLAREVWAPNYFWHAAPAAKLEAWTDEVADMALSLGADVFCRQTRAQIARPDSVPSLASIEVPAMIVRGEDDRLVPASDLALLARHIPHAQSATLQGCGHMIPMEQPEALCSLLRSFFKDIRHDH
ncbi:alpha/beta fold hydrolase [Ramlibacter sp.]|uniref:alpha/beta fold hydrolase n=1 Tax=Ramlibacter sp. TaxID=1917967 RepID=UPI003D0BC49F